MGSNPLFAFCPLTFLANSGLDPICFFLSATLFLGTTDAQIPAGATTDHGGLDFASGRQLNSTKSLAYMPFRNTPPIGALACVEKMIGKPYVGEPQVRFDEGEQPLVSRWILNAHAAGNGGYSQEFTYRTIILFSTLPYPPYTVRSTIQGCAVQ
jgi:hypothetical protein